MQRLIFPKSARLLKPAEFDRVFRKRTSASDGMIVLYAALGTSEQPRLGLTVSRKRGNAVVRNRWKRSLREAFRLVQHDLPRHLDLVVLPQRGAAPDVVRLQSSLLKLALKLSKKLSASSAGKEPKS
jgi:ribonuclease P protein component